MLIHYCSDPQLVSDYHRIDYRFDSLPRVFRRMKYDRFPVTEFPVTEY